MVKRYVNDILVGVALGIRSRPRKRLSPQVTKPAVIGGYSCGRGGWKFETACSCRRRRLEIENRLQFVSIQGSFLFATVRVNQSHILYISFAPVPHIVRHHPSQIWRRQTSSARHATCCHVAWSWPSPCCVWPWPWTPPSSECLRLGLGTPISPNPKSPTEKF